MGGSEDLLPDTVSYAYSSAHAEFADTATYAINCEILNLLTVQVIRIIRILPIMHQMEFIPILLILPILPIQLVSLFLHITIGDFLAIQAPVHLPTFRHDRFDRFSH